MGSFIFTLFAGALAGALTARTIIRRELRNVGQDSILPAGLQPAPAPAPTTGQTDTTAATAATDTTAAPAPTTATDTTAATAPTAAPYPSRERQRADSDPNRERQRADSDVTPEILMVLTAAVAAFLGKKAKIRRARVAQYAGLSSAWAQQGRVFVQASHNLPSPHHH